MTTLSNLIIYSLFIIQIVSVSYCAEKELYFFGGGGEPKGPTTIFDGHINLVSRFITTKGAGWKASHSFNGGHQVTEKEIKTKLASSQSLGSFDEKNFQQALGDLEEKIESGNLKSGDQLMVIIDSHGAMKAKNEKTHSIALSGTAENLKNLSGTQTTSMDEFEILITLARQKGVKLALVDLSCFSGNTLQLAHPDICIVSASGENHYGYAEDRLVNDNSPYVTFGGRFLEGLKKGKNVEDIFLKARAGSVYADFPMISTETGRMVNDLIYELITPYLVYNFDTITDFSDSYDLKNVAEALCKTDNQFNQIKKRIDEISSMAKIPKELLDTKKLKKALDAYRKYQLNYEKALSETGVAALEIKEFILRDYPDKAALFAKEDGLSILTVSRESALKTYKELAESSKAVRSKEFYQKIYSELLIKDAISKDISKKLSKKSMASIKKFDEIFARSGKTQELASNVSTEAKNLYDKLYRLDQVYKEEMTSNPCKDFVL